MATLRLQGEGGYHPRKQTSNPRHPSVDFYHYPVAVWVNSAPQPKRWGPRAHRGTNLGENWQIFLAVWPWNLTDDLEKQKGTSSKQHQALCFISSSYVQSNWSYGPETAKWGHDLCDLDLWPLTLTFCMDVTSVIGNNSWKFMMIRWQEHSQKGVTDRRTDRRTEPFIEMLGRS